MNEVNKNAISLLKDAIKRIKKSDKEGSSLFMYSLVRKEPEIGFIGGLSFDTKHKNKQR